MSAELKVQSQIQSVRCCECGLLFGMESGFLAGRQRDHGVFYCPSGHSQYYAGETNEERLKKQLEDERSRTAFYRRESELQKRSRAAMKGQLTKTRNRIAKGVCPCCNRHFANLHQHMNTQHPDYTTQD